MASLRLLDDLTADGPEQMAADEALLEAATSPTLRVYTWDPPTVSLGYFQDHAGIHHRLKSLGPVPPLVRRITGGGAIWHQDEITYALVGILGQDGLPTRTAGVYRLLHGAIRAELDARGAPLQTQDRTVGDRRYAREPRCFASPAAEDLIRDEAKVLGSAARTRGERLLIHGSLKLASNPWDGDAVAGCGLDGSQARAALIAGVATALGLDVEAGTWTDAELAARRRIRAQRYGDTRWVVERIGPRA